MKNRLIKLIESNKVLHRMALFIYQPFRGFLKRRITDGKTSLNILKTFPMFEAHGWGLYPIRAKLTVQSINQTIPALSRFSRLSEKNINFEKELKKSFSDHESAHQKKLKELFQSYGSDKSSMHDYYRVYADIIHGMGEAKKLFEIGLGTNNTDIVSTMGRNGKPGASLRSFRDFQPSLKIYGADFDKRILFSEDRIETFFVDQTDPQTFEDLSQNIGDNFDLMIDDGLHSPNANLNSLEFFLRHIKVGGYAIVEDINISTKPIWNIVSHLIEPDFISAFIETKAACMFIVKRKK